MKVLILGGTRFFGLEVARRLAARGDEVTVLSRRRPEGLTARHIAGDRAERAVLEEAGRQRFDAVFDNIAFNAAHVTTLLDAIGSVGRYVLTSTGSVYMTGDAPGPISEEAWLPPGAPGLLDETQYGLGKRAAERALHERRGQAGHWTILRPTIVFGPGDPTERLLWYARTLLEGKPIGSGEFVFNPVFSGDVATLSVRVLDGFGPAGRCYNVAGREVLSVRDLCIRLQGLLQIPGPGFSMPGEPTSPPPFPGRGRFVLSIERALQELDFRPTPLGDWLPGALEGLSRP